MKTGPFLWLMAAAFVVALGYGVALPMLPFFLELWVRVDEPGAFLGHRWLTADQRGA